MFWINLNVDAILVFMRFKDPIKANVLLAKRNVLIVLILLLIVLLVRVMQIEKHKSLPVNV